MEALKSSLQKLASYQVRNIVDLIFLCSSFVKLARQPKYHHQYYYRQHRKFESKWECEHSLAKSLSKSELAGFFIPFYWPQTRKDRQYAMCFRRLGIDQGSRSVALSNWLRYVLCTEWPASSCSPIFSHLASFAHAIPIPDHQAHKPFPLHLPHGLPVQRLLLVYELDISLRGF